MEAPIGVFDSGVGGLTVVREILRQMPGERIVYFGDTARVPYGSKSKETVIRYSRQILHFLENQGVKAVVVACNTASSYALADLKEQSGVPVLGVIHAGALSAARATRNGRIGIIGTRGTVSSNIYPATIHGMNPALFVVQKACPLLVPLVEEGLIHDSITDEVIARYVNGLKSKYIDTLVLGCTHYPLLRKTIGRIMGGEVHLVNPAYETAVELKQLLEQEGLKRKGEPLPLRSHSFYVSDMAERFQEFASSILPDTIGAAEMVNLENY